MLALSSANKGMTAMKNRDSSVSELCEELGVSRVTLYRYVSPTGDLKENGQKVLDG